MPRAPKATTPAPEPVKVSRPRVTGKARTQLVASLKRQYRGGDSIAKVAADHNVSYGFAQRELAAAGTKIRSRGGSKPKAKK